MSATLVQKKHLYGGGATQAIAFTSNVGAGHLLVCYFSMWKQATSATIVGSLNGSFTVKGPFYGGQGIGLNQSASLFLGYVWNCIAGAETITFTPTGGGGDCGGTIFEYSGIITGSDPLHQISATSYPANVNDVNASVTTTKQCLLFLGGAKEDGNGGYFTAVNSPFTIESNETTHYDVQADAAGQVAGSYTGTWTIQNSGYNNRVATALAAFEESATAAFLAQFEKPILTARQRAASW